jgi:hypothetical protein
MATTHTDHSRTPLVGRLEALTAIIVVGVLGLALGLASLAVPSAKSTTRALAYRQTGAFSYSAPAPRHSIYGSAGVQTGDPIATNVVKQVAVRFHYDLASRTPVITHGTASLVAQVKLAQGLVRRFVITRPHAFTGSSVTTAGSLSVSRINHFLTGSSAALSSDAATGAMVSLVASVKTAGRIGGRALTTTYSPSLPFMLDGSSLTLSQGSSAAISGSHGSVASSRSGSVKMPATVANTINLLVVRPSVRLAREIGFGVALVCLLLGLFVARPLLRRGASATDRDRVRALYGSLLVPVDNLVTPGAAVAEVSTMGALAEIAKRYECMIMHSRKDDRDEYMVWDNGILYRRTVPNAVADGKRVVDPARTPAVAPAAAPSPRVIVLPEAAPVGVGMAAARRGLRREPRRVSV